jgi:GNAT superfamily N-acetyltransferase
MISIRNATSEDVTLIQNLNDEVFVDNVKYLPDLDMNWAKGEYGLKYFTELINDESNLCLIAEDDGKAIGYLAASPKKFTYRTLSYTELENMGVTPEYQSKGIGAQLLELYLQWSREGGYEKAYVNTFAKNAGALKFYRKHGFADIDISLEMKL